MRGTLENNLLVLFQRGKMLKDRKSLRTVPNERKGDTKTKCKYAVLDWILGQKSDVS